jgi:hypothetical protein
MASANMVGANRSIAAVADEVEHFIREDELVPTSHPVAKAHPELFGAPERPVEQATAAQARSSDGSERSRGDRGVGRTESHSRFHLSLAVEGGEGRGLLSTPALTSDTWS